MNYARQALYLMDLTSLNDNDTEETIYDLCMRTKTPYGSVAAICIYSHLIHYAKRILAKYNPSIRIATVCNFPHGLPDIERAMFETELALKRGADEIDIVFPYHALITGDRNIGAKMISNAKKICQDKILKVIIESGDLHTPQLIQLASMICIDNGADFIKTSTGKVGVNATLEATRIMLTTLCEHKSNCGFKAAGGIKSVVEAQKYLELAIAIMGKEWVTAQHFRFGASSLLNDILINLAR